MPKIKRVRQYAVRGKGFLDTIKKIGKYAIPAVGLAGLAAGGTYLASRSNAPDTSRDLLHTPAAFHAHYGGHVVTSHKPIMKRHRNKKTGKFVKSRKRGKGIAGDAWRHIKKALPYVIPAAAVAAGGYYAYKHGKRLGDSYIRKNIDDFNDWEMRTRGVPESLIKFVPKTR